MTPLRFIDSSFPRSTSSVDNRGVEESRSRSGEALCFTLKVFPFITLATIGLCFATQLVASWFGIKLPDQQNIDIVRQWGAHCFDSVKAFGIFTFLILQIVVLMPALEELIFRLPSRLLWKRRDWWIGASVALAALFSAAHYIFQPWPDAAFLALFFFGLAQCWIYHATQRLWCALLNHALFNLVNLLLLFALPAN